MTKTAKLYGDSFYELITEDSVEESMGKSVEKTAGGSAEEQAGGTKPDQSGVYVEELQCIARLFGENPDYLRLLQEPSVPRRERLDLIDAAFKGAHLYTKNFLKLLLEEGIIGEFAGCCEEVIRRYMQDHDIEEAVVTSAVPLDPRQEKALTEKLSQKYGKKILLTRKVDPTLIGGLRVEIGGEQLDGTVRSKLDRIHRQIRQ